MDVSNRTIRDVASVALGVITSGVGLVGFAGKKLLTKDDSSLMRHIVVGGLATALTGGVALLPYLLATSPVRAENQAAKGDIVSRRYDG